VVWHRSRKVHSFRTLSILMIGKVAVSRSYTIYVPTERLNEKTAADRTITTFIFRRKPLHATVL